MSIYARIAEEKLRAMFYGRTLRGQVSSQKLDVKKEDYNKHPDPRCAEEGCTFSVDIFEIQLLEPNRTGTIRLMLGMEIYTSEKCPEKCDFDHICYPEFEIELDDYGRVKNIKLIDPGC